MISDEQRKELVNWLVSPGNNFCAMPFIHMAIEGNGDLLPCCMGSKLPANISGNTFNDMKMHPSRADMQTAFKNNKKFSNCATCWRDKTEFSPRVKFSINPHAQDFTWNVYQGADPEPQLTWLEIKPGNRCNLKCRICGVHNSSSWAKDHYRLYDFHMPYKETWIHKHQTQCEWIDEPQVWEDVSGLEHVDTIHMMGGEPFMIEEHFEFLQRFADAYDISKVTLWYNTNGTWTIPDRYQELFDSIGSVKLSISIDDIEDRYNYQRPGVDWTKARQTVDQLFDLNSKSNYHVRLDPTVSIHNVYYLNEFVEFCNQNDWLFNRSPNHFVDNRSTNNIRTLSTHQREKVSQHLLVGQHSNHPLVQNAIEYMRTDQWELPLEQERVDRIRQLDQMRDENFAQVFPEMNTILGVYE